MKVVAKKRFGQNFLHDPIYISKIYQASQEIYDNCKPKSLIEVGPGLGDLTREYIKINKDIVLYEIDPDLIPILQEEFKDTIIHNQDFMELIPNLPDCMLVSNLPYYIGSRLIIDLIAYNKTMPFAFILQKEVAFKIKASEDITFFGAAINLFYSPKVEFTIPPQAFRPAPKVYSALLTATPLNTEYSGLEAITILKAMFFKPTKTMFNNLIYGGIAKEEVVRIYDKYKFDSNLRVRWENYKEVFGILYNELSSLA
jgi:16S rRNA (adenine1518-N6/adenine1519-N6)-dimethyltransferase